MNYLAHAHLSFGLPQILIGNMISDFVKGKKQYDFSPMIQKGIRLHRSIDSFTDAHPVTKEMKEVFKPAYGLYAGAFTDIVYDYFLANDSNEFTTDQELELFSNNSYFQIEKSLAELPPGFQQIFPFMKQYNWLYNYRHQHGIQKSFAGLVKRAKYIEDHDTAFRIFTENLQQLNFYYAAFFPLLKIHATHTLAQLLKTD